jgi:sec-independent protein translocase protein TatA
MIFAKPWADALIVLLVVLLFFGPKRLPALGKSLGEGMREFKDSITGHSEPDEESERPALTPAATGEPAATEPGAAATNPVSSEPTKVASTEPRA